VRVRPPPLPFTVSMYVPGFARLETVSFRVTLPGGVRRVRLQLRVAVSPAHPLVQGG